jgi:hypothetical protein
VGATYEAQGAASVSRPVGRLVEVVDRFFFLIWIGFYLLLPVSGWASVMFKSWFDQRLYLSALRSVLAVGHAEAISTNTVGPAYIAAAALLHDVLGSSPEDSLILLSRGGYAFSAACGIVLVRVVVRGLVGAPPLVTIGAQFAFAASVFAAGTWHWSDVPWTHFFAAFLAAAIYAVRFAPTRLTVASAAATGALLALLSLTRSFEFAAVVVAWGVGLVVLAALRLSGSRTLRLGHVLSGGLAFVATSAVVYLVTGKRDLFILYGSNLDHLSAHQNAEEIAQTPTFNLALVPTKLVQLFVEPCYRAICSIADYQGGETQLLPPRLAQAGIYRLWSLPLSVQLPALVLLPICVLAVAVLVVWATRRRAAASARSSQLRLLVEMTVASTGLVLGYTASTLTGSPHLRYGFARDFLLPALLSGIVAVSLVSAGLWLVLSRKRARRRRVSPEFAFVVLALAGSCCLVFALAYARANGIPRIESKQLGSVSYAATCRHATCDVSIAAKTTSGVDVSIPQSSILTFGCDSDAPRFTLYEKTPTTGVHLSRACPHPRLVAAWPIAMGLPPGSFELSAVQVENERP